MKIATAAVTVFLVGAWCGLAEGGTRSLDYLDPVDFESLYPEYFYQPSQEEDENELISRARPNGNKKNSPIYYIRLPASPYVLVPGVGYVSRPPSLRPPPSTLAPPTSSIIKLPLPFVNNGKPSNIFSWNAPASPPKDSAVHNLDKGPYYFNGRPSDIFLLANTYNSLYDDGLQNFYP